MNSLLEIIRLPYKIIIRHPLIIILIIKHMINNLVECVMNPDNIVKLLAKELDEFENSINIDILNINIIIISIIVIIINK